MTDKFFFYRIKKIHITILDYVQTLSNIILVETFKASYEYNSLIWQFLWVSHSAQKEKNILDYIIIRKNNIFATASVKRK